MRILHVIDSLGEGGAEQNLLTLVRQLRPPSFEHHIAWLYSDERLRDLFAPHVHSLVPLNVGRGPAQLAAGARRLATWMRANGTFDLVSVKLIRAQLVARLAARLAGGVPVVSTWECVSYNDRMYIELGRKGPLLRELTRVLDGVSGIGDAHFIAVSEEVKQHNSRVLHVRPDRVTVVYNAVDPSRVVDLDEARRAELRRSLGVAPAGKLLLSVGRLVDQKDHRTTISAMPHILREDPTAVLVIAGTGQLRDELQAQIDGLKLGQRARLLGPRRDVPELLRAADLFVFASVYEGLGIALQEAIAAGLPALSSRIPTSEEVARGSSAIQFFETRDPEDLARRALSMLRDPALRATAEREAPAARRRFSPESMARGYADVYRRAAGAA